MADVRRVTAIMDALAPARRQLTVRDIALQTGIPRSSVHRIVHELVASGHVIAAPSGGYRAGPSMIKMALCQRDWASGPHRSRLTALSAAVGESVDLAILAGSTAMIVDRITVATQPVADPIGRSIPLHTTCIGRSLLAQLPDATVAELMPAQPVDSPQELPGLLDDLAEIRRCGYAIDQYAIDHEDHRDGVCAIAAPLPGIGDIPRAVAIVVPTARFIRRRSAYAEALTDLRGRVPILV